MPARILYIPFVLLALLLLYLSWEVSESYAYWLPAPIIVLSVIYVLSPQVNWWWYVRHTPELEDAFRRLMLDKHPYYARLNLEDKKLFRQRVFLFRLAQDFMPQGWENVPVDVQTVLSIQAVTLTFGWSNYLLPPYEKVVVYPHAFPSPQFPKHVHHAELYEEDAVLIFNARRVMEDTIRSAGSFNIGLYEYARVLLRVHPRYPWPEEEAAYWEGLERLKGYSRTQVAAHLGLPEKTVEVLPVCLVAYFLQPEYLAKALPSLVAGLRDIMQFDPLAAERLKHPSPEQTA